MKIFCIGRNYAAHAKEMKSTVPKSPMVFMKPATALLKPGKDFYFPSFTDTIHYECELVIKICKNGKNIEPQFARNYYNAYTLGLDLTARAIQAKCKEKGHPWEIAKAFDNSAPIGKFKDLAENESLADIEFTLQKNGEVVQMGMTKDLIFSLETLISHISKFFSLQKGDLIFTGTPEGVGPIAIGDTLIAFLGKKKILSLNVK